MNGGRDTTRAQGAAIYSLALACVIGWGCFVMPGTTFLPSAGVFGAIIGIVIAGVYALAIAYNYAQLAKDFPGADCSYQLIRGVFGMDHAFFSVRALLLAYITVLLANASAFALLGRFLFGRGLMVGFHYHIMGYDAYLGEILLSAATIAVCGFIVCRGYKLVMQILVLLAVLLVGAVGILFIGILIRSDTAALFSPSFAMASPMSRGGQIMSIAVIAPWLYVGFEAVIHMTPTTRLKPKGILAAAVLAILTGMALYCMLVVFANVGTPRGYHSWEDYTAKTGGINVFADMPTLMGIRRYLGGFGVAFFSIALFAALLSSVLGFLLVASRTLRIMADDGLVYKGLSQTNARQMPHNAIWFLCGISFPALFLGMNMIGWAVDISTLSISIVYGYISIGALMRPDMKGWGRVCAFAGAVLSFSSLFLMMVPNTVVGEKLSTEDYLIFAVWCLVGMVHYRYVLARDEEYKLGKSMIMWLLMFFLLFFSSNMWTHARLQKALMSMQSGAEIPGILMTNNLIRTIVVLVALIILFELFSVLMRRQRQLDAKVEKAESKNKSKVSLLSNMSHDIRTPMNAIAGFTDLALQEGTSREGMAEYLNKIKVSSSHLISLIEDVLEMSRMEGETLTLKNVPVNLPALLAQVQNTTKSRAKSKDLKIMLAVYSLEDENVRCDPQRLSQALLYLTANAVKFTQDGDIIEIGIMQISPAQDGRATYQFAVRDNGHKMTEELAERIFDSLTGDDPYTSADTQGAEFGMIITRKILDAMGGRIEINAKPESGTEVFITIEFETTDEKVRIVDAGYLSGLAGKRALVADDIMVNRQIAAAILNRSGIETEEAKDGAEALEKVSSSLPGHFDLVLMDIQMPKMNGYDATSRIRALPDPINSSIPIIAMTANVFDEDKERAFSVGMNGFVPKPIDRMQLVKTLAEVFSTAEEGE